MPGHIKWDYVKRPVISGMDMGRKFDHNVDAMRYEVKLNGGRSNEKTFLQQYLYEVAFLRNTLNEEVGMNGIRGLDKYIISAKGTTVIFWKNGNKTTVRPRKGITPDPVLGFLYNYYKHNFGLSKTQYKKILSTVKEDKIKEFLVEQFKIKNSQTDPAKLVKFLENLKVEPYDKVVKIKTPMDIVEVLDLD
jgi:hypothetical protein